MLNRLVDVFCGPQDKASGPSGDYGTFMVGTEGGRIFKCYNDVNDHNAKEFAKVGALQGCFSMVGTPQTCVHGPAAARPATKSDVTQRGDLCSYTQRYG